MISGGKESNLRTLCAFLFVGFGIIGPNQSSAAESKESQAHRRNDEPPQKSLYVHYRYTTETTYEDIEIKDSVLKFTSLNETSQQRIQKEAVRSVESKRFWTNPDLVTKEANLSQRQIQDLINLIRRSGFMQLDDSYGGNGPGGRHYPELISIKLGDAKKDLTYKHLPGASAMPKAFAIVRRRLFEVINAKFPALKAKVSSINSSEDRSFSGWTGGAAQLFRGGACEEWRGFRSHSAPRAGSSQSDGGVARDAYAGAGPSDSACADKKPPGNWPDVP